MRQLRLRLEAGEPDKKERRLAVSDFIPLEIYTKKEKIISLSEMDKFFVDSP